MLVYREWSSTRNCWNSLFIIINIIIIIIINFFLVSTFYARVRLKAPLYYWHQNQIVSFLSAA